MNSCLTYISKDKTNPPHADLAATLNNPRRVGTAPQGHCDVKLSGSQNWQVPAETGRLLTPPSSRTGRRSDPQLLRDCVESLCSVARDLHDDGGARDDVSVHGDDDVGMQGPADSRAESRRGLESVARSLLFCLETDRGLGPPTPRESPGGR